MKQEKRLLVLVMVMVFFIVSCGKLNFKNEFDTYTHYQKHLKEMAEKYPAFRSLMVILSNEAYSFVADNQNLRTDSQKAQKLVDANRVFSTSEFYRRLSSFDARVDAIKQKKNSLANITDPKQQAAIRSAIAEVDRALSEALAIMKNAKPVDMESAVAEIKKADGILIEVEMDGVRR